ncbi:MAG: MFS transporter, partial [Streptosporangiaceae bacterium]
MGQPELSGRRRYLVLAICCISLFIVGIDATIVNVALPSIQRDLHAPVSGLQWIVDAYTLVLASLLMLSGSTGERAGRRRTFQTGLECSRSDRCSAAWHLRRGDLAHQPAPWRRGRRRRARGRHRRAGSG